MSIQLNEPMRFRPREEEMDGRWERTIYDEKGGKVVFFACCFVAPSAFLFVLKLCLWKIHRDHAKRCSNLSFEMRQGVGKI